MGSITVDSSSWPLVRVTYIDSVDDARFDAYVREQAALLERREPYVILFDATESGMPNARQRQRMAEYSRDHEEELRRYCKRGVFVIPNSVIRGALTAILWVQPLPFPHSVVSSVSEAEQILDAERRLFA